MKLHQSQKSGERTAHKVQREILKPANAALPKLLTVITLRPLGAKTDEERRQHEALDMLSDICAVHGWALRSEVVFNSHSAGGDRWAKRVENRRQVRKFQDNLWHRLSYHEPDVVLVSGLQTARQFCAALRDHVSSESTIKDLYQSNYHDTSSRYAVLAGGHRIRVRLCPDLAWYGEDVASRSRLPEGTWPRMIHDVMCYVSGDQHHPEALLEKVKARKALEAEAFLHGCAPETLNGHPVVRLKGDLKEELSHE